jgi:hypothetical protein
MSKFRILKTSIALGLVGSLFVACGGTSPEGGVEAETAPIVAATSTVELISSADARTQLASGDVNFGGGTIMWMNVPGAHQSFVRFDLGALPAGAIVESAELKLYFNGHYAGTNSAELGRVEGDWDEGAITWNTQPSVLWGGPTAPVGDAAGDITFDVTDLVAKWHDGEAPNYGFALRSTQNGGKQFWSRESSSEFPPRLVITYSYPTPPGPRPDLGDAPDTSNGLGIPNTAYPLVGVLGQFPTVFNVPANQAAGPRHDNATIQAILGQYMSGETEAHVGPDQDGVNNILRNPANGMVGDFDDNDRGDDGWRNRGIRFYNCQTQTLQIRVSKPVGATRPFMYLNVHFDGFRDGDWDDNGPCIPPGGGPPQPASEWIVRNRVINMAMVPPGGSFDFAVNTVRVLNTTEGLPHWMRFTLSDTPAVVPPIGGMPDGRGPHPMNSPIGFAFGETEDVFQLPPPPPPPPALEP